MILVYDPYIGHYQVLPFWVREELGAMAMTGGFAFPNAPELLKLHRQII